MQQECIASKEAEWFPVLKNFCDILSYPTFIRAF